MPDKAEVALLPALAEGLGALEVDVVQIAVVALVLVLLFLFDEFGHFGQDVLLLLWRKLPVKDGLAAVHDHVQGLVEFFQIAGKGTKPFLQSGCNAKVIPLLWFNQTEIMSDKIKQSYRQTRNIYDDVLTRSKWWSRPLRPLRH